MTRPFLRRVSLISLVLLVVVQSPVRAGDVAGDRAQSCLARTFHGKDVLMLGASLSYGFQTDEFLSVIGTPFVPDEVFPGWEAPMLRTLATRGIHARSLNFSCPGEATDTFVTGGCWWIPAGFPLHDGRTYTSQLEAVEAFLVGHPGQVGALVFDLGPNDSYALISGCAQNSADPLACVRAGAEAAMATALSSWNILLDRLQPLAPDAVFLVTVAQDLGAFLPLPGVSEWWTTYKAQFVPLLHSRGVLTIDLERSFGTSSARQCQLTGVCNAVSDVHPSDKGYALIADMQLRRIARSCRGR